MCLQLFGSVSKKCCLSKLDPGGIRDEKEELGIFIRLAEQNGYSFRTLDTYVNDIVSTVEVT